MSVAFCVISIPGFALDFVIDGKDVTIPVCGGFAGLQCESNQWCDYSGASAVCGIGDQFGTCRTKPEVCTAQYAPVCGCNGKTYSNACKAAEDGQSAAHAGVCKLEAK